ncbi:MAG: hypothetical protein KKI08_20275 [Armatimonadetes bacterium]|nr:hypothetical protein [Armatimonadota bacterium]
MTRKRRRQPTEVRLHLRFYAGQDDELIRWLEQFDEQPYGLKTQAVKEALRRSLGADEGQITTSAPTLDLGEVRRVVEAAVTTALSRFEGQGGRSPVALPAEDDETENLLDSLEAALVLREDEE